MRQFKILGSITPGQSLVLEARIEGALDGVVQVSGSVLDDQGNKLAMGGVLLAGQL